MKNETTSVCCNCMFYSETTGCLNPERCDGLCIKKIAKIETPDISTKCLICGKEIILASTHQSSVICSDCKRAIEWAKRGLEAEITNSLECRQGLDPNGFRITVKEFVQRFVPHGSIVQIYKEDVAISTNGITLIDYNKIWEGADHFITDCDEKAFCSVKDCLVEGLITFKNDVLKSVDALGKVAISIKHENKEDFKNLNCNNSQNTQYELKG